MSIKIHYEDRSTVPYYDQKDGTSVALQENGNLFIATGDLRSYDNYSNLIYAYGINKDMVGYAIDDLFDEIAPLCEQLLNLYKNGQNTDAIANKIDDIIDYYDEDDFDKNIANVVYAVDTMEYFQFGETPEEIYDFVSSAGREVMEDGNGYLVYFPNRPEDYAEKAKTYYEATGEYEDDDEDY